MNHDFNELNSMTVEQFTKYIEDVEAHYKEDLKNLKCLLRLKAKKKPVVIADKTATS